MSRAKKPDLDVRNARIDADMTTDEYNDAVMAAMTEAEFQGWIVRLAIAHGWQRELIYHTHDSSKSQRGFPDLVLVKGRKVRFWELKVKPNTASIAQAEWIDVLRAAGMDAAVLYPEQWEWIQVELAA